MYLALCVYEFCLANRFLVPLYDLSDNRGNFIKLLFWKSFVLKCIKILRRIDSESAVFNRS